MLRPLAFLTTLFIGLAMGPVAFAAEKVIVRLDWFVNPVHTALVIAKQKAFSSPKGSM